MSAETTHRRATFLALFIAIPTREATCRAHVLLCIRTSKHNAHVCDEGGRKEPSPCSVSSSMTACQVAESEKAGVSVQEGCPETGVCGSVPGKAIICGGLCGAIRPATGVGLAKHIMRYLKRHKCALRQGLHELPERAAYEKWFCDSSGTQYLRRHVCISDIDASINSTEHTEYTEHSLRVAMHWSPFADT